jgi:hypothetical protein
MQYDICLKCDSVAALVAALKPFGLTTADDDGNDVLLTASHEHALAWYGPQVQTPAVYDAETEAVMWPGEYAILRGDDETLDRISAAQLDGVEVQDSPINGMGWGDTWMMRPEGPSLTSKQALACARIDATAEALCNQVITPGSAQMGRYQRKEAQARAFLDAVIPDDPAALEAFKRQYAAIYGEVGITADTPLAVARVVVAKADAWWAYGDAVETARLAGKRDVMAAVDLAGVAAAETAVVWPAGSPS